MINIEEQLNKLPKGKLSRQTDFKLHITFLKLKLQKQSVNFNFLSAFRKMSPAIIAMILLLSLVYLPYYAYASENVIRGNILYPIKQGIEKIELVLADTPAKKVAVMAKLAERRLAETEKLSEDESMAANDNLAATINEITNLTTEAAFEAKSKLNPDEKKEVDDKIFQIKERQLEKMEKIANKFGLKASDDLLDSLAVNIDDLKKDKQVKNNFSEVLSTVKISTSTRNLNFIPQAVNRLSSSSASTSTATAKRGGAGSKIDQKIIFESWNNANKQINTLKVKLLDEGIGEKEFNDLFIKLDDRLSKAQAAINYGNFNQANGLIKSTEALSNNAKHFLRFGEQGTSTVNQATSSVNQATSSISSWRKEIKERIKGMGSQNNDRK